MTQEEEDSKEIQLGEVNFVETCGLHLVKQLEELKQKSSQLQQENDDLRSHIYNDTASTVMTNENKKINKNNRSRSHMGYAGNFKGVILGLEKF